MKTAMIWGAGGGIGRELVTQLVADDWTVLAVARQLDAIASLTPLAFEADLSVPYEVGLAVTAAGQEVDAVDLWAYTAGDIVAAKVGELPPDRWQQIIDANLTGPFLATYYSLPLLSSDAHMFFLGAVSERVRLPGLSAYAAAKAGLEAFAAALAKEERGRRVTVVRPGAVDTAFWARVPNFKLPKRTLAPAQVATAILDAYRDGTTGNLDLS